MQDGRHKRTCIGARACAVRRSSACLCGVAVFALLPGCESMLNGWLDPTQVGSFSRESTVDIRNSLSIQDPPSDLAAAEEPTPQDLIPYLDEYRFTKGDFVEVGIYELRLRGIEERDQVQIDELGRIALPIIGRVPAADLTAQEVEAEIVRTLNERELIRDAQVRVSPLTRRGASYVVIGFFGGIQTGNARFGPGVAFIPAPDFRLQEALATAGGFEERVEEIRVFRKTKSDPPPDLAPSSAPEPSSLRSSDASWPRRAQTPVQATSYVPGAQQDPQTAPQDDEARALIEAITGRSDTQPSQEPPSGAPGGRWMFIEAENRWVEVPIESVPATAPATLPAPIPGIPDEPGEAEPVIDWDAVAGFPEYRIIRVPIKAIRNLDPQYNIVIRPGDVIQLKAQIVGLYYMAGQVARPGAYGINAQKITLKAAIAAAGGLAPLAWPDRCTVYRRYGDREEMIQVNIDRIFAGRDPDFYVKPDDIINIGSHPAAVFLATARNAFRMFYGFGFVYDRNFADIDSFGGQINPDAINELGNRFPGLFQNR